MRIHVAHDLAERDIAIFVIEFARAAGHDVTDPVESHAASIANFRDVDLYVAVVASNASRVYFELGMAAALRKEILVIARSEADLTVDLATIPSVVFGEDASRSEQDLRAAIDRAVERLAASRGSATTEPQLNFFSSPAFEKQIYDQVTAWFRERGAQVEVASGSRDVRNDVLVKDPGHGLLAIEIRAVAPQDRVSLEPIRQLRNMMAHTGASHGLLLTTGSATRAASEFAEAQGVSVVSVEKLLSSGSLDDIVRPLSRRMPTVADREIAGAIPGYWFGPSEAIPDAPVGFPTSAVLGPSSNRGLHGDDVTCLDLVRVGDHWLVLSELARLTYQHTSGLLSGEKWIFVPIDASFGPWPAVFAVEFGPSVPHREIAPRYGVEAAGRARSDAPAVQLLMRRHSQ